MRPVKTGVPLAPSWSVAGWSPRGPELHLEPAISGAAGDDVARISAVAIEAAPTGRIIAIPLAVAPTQGIFDGQIRFGIGDRRRRRNSGTMRFLGHCRDGERKRKCRCYNETESGHDFSPLCGQMESVPPTRPVHQLTRNFANKIGLPYKIILIVRHRCIGLRQQNKKEVRL